MYRGFLSWRYLVKRPTNLIGIVGILVAVGALILILSIMTGFLEESRRTLRGSLADILIQPIPGPGTETRDPAALLAAVRADTRVAAAAPQLVYGATITQRQNRLNTERLLSSQIHSGLLVVQLVGIDVLGAERLGEPLQRTALGLLGGLVPPRRIQDELDATAFLHSLIGDEPGPEPWTAEPINPLFPFLTPATQASRTRTPGPPLAAVLVGEQLYEDLGLLRGEVIEIVTPVVDPESGDFVPNNREYLVAGTFRTRENETDLDRIYLAREELAEFLGGTRGFSQVLVRLHDYGRDAAAVTADLRAELAQRGLISGGEPYGHGRDEVRTWEEFRGNLLGAIENERVLMAIMLSLVLVVAGFTIFAILSMMVTEKRRDIGILSALGATPPGILQLFLLIAWWDALLGATVGGIIGTWMALEIDPLERWLSSTFGVEIFDRDVYLFDHIPAVVQPLSVALIVLGAFVCALVFAALPAWRAARLDPLDALRYE